MAKTKIPLKLKIRIPHVVLDVRGANPALVEKLLPGLEELPARFHILGEGAKTYPHVFSFEEALEEAHIWLVLGNHLPSQFSMIIDRGIVPVMQSGLHKDAENYNPVEESGNSFLFQKPGVWTVHAALVRALENFAFAYDWENLRDQGKALMKL
ncbi:MAG: hypothetical protein WC924_03080 [Candidatus Gracilibacteria bacterium]